MPKASAQPRGPWSSAKQEQQNKERLERIDKHIADSEQKVSEQALRYEIAVFNGHSGDEEKKLLRIFENILFESIRARAALEGRSPQSASPDR